MAYTGYKVLKAPIDQIETIMNDLIGDGWQPLGAPTLTYPNSNMVYQAIVQGTPDGGDPVTIVVNDITDATDTGKAVLLADDEEAARAAIGAGTSSLALGSGATQASAGNHNHAVTADVGSGLAEAANIQELAVAMSARIKVLEDAAP